MMICLLVGILTISAIIANRITIVNPLMHVMKSLDSFRKKGIRKKVLFRSGDELGSLVQAYNGAVK